MTATPVGAAPAVDTELEELELELEPLSTAGAASPVSCAPAGPVTGPLPLAAPVFTSPVTPAGAVIVASVVAVLDTVAVSVAVGVVSVDAGFQSFQNEGVTVSVPLYAGQPGIVLGGARPPPQSTPRQISPVSGTYHNAEL